MLVRRNLLSGCFQAGLCESTALASSRWSTARWRVCETTQRSSDSGIAERVICSLAAFECDGGLLLSCERHWQSYCWRSQRDINLLRDQREASWFGALFVDDAVRAKPEVDSVLAFRAPHNILLSVFSLQLGVRLDASPVSGASPYTAFSHGNCCVGRDPFFISQRGFRASSRSSLNSARMVDGIGVESRLLRST